MNIEQLTIVNFRSFQGKHTLKLQLRAENNHLRPIVLVGGLNGTGKTSLLLAMKLVLYGRNALGLGTSNAAYHRFVRGCIYESPRSSIYTDIASVNLIVTDIKLGQKHTYEISRSWKLGGKSIQEFLSLWKDGVEQDSLSAQECQGFLNDLIPYGVSELFFFDGERIAELAYDNSGEILKDAIYKLLGVDLVIRLQNDLRVYVLKTEAKSADTKTSKIIDVLGSQYKEIKAEIAKHQKKLEESKVKILNLAIRKDRLENQLTERGGEWGITRETFQSEAKDLSNMLQHIEREIRDELSSCYPLLLAETELNKALTKSQIRSRAIQNKEINNVLDTFVARLKANYETRSKSIEFSEIDELLEDFRRSEHSNPTAMELTSTEISEIKFVLDTLLPHTKSKVSDLVDEMMSLNAELEKISLKMQRAPDKLTLEADFKKLTKLTNQIAKAKADALLCEMELKKFYREGISIARSLQNTHNKIAESTESKRPLEYASKVRSLLDEFISISTKRKVHELEIEFNEIFSRLLRKEDIVCRARIDACTFEINLIDIKGNKIEKNRLSAGERQIFAISILKALAKVSGRNLPIIIDTPLSRLDSKHRTNLIRHYFPHASHQVILLSTDTEVDNEFYQELLPYISHTYKITFDEKNLSSTLCEGYFWSDHLREVV